MRDRIEEALWNHGENSWEHLEAIGNLVNAYSKIPLKNGFRWLAACQKAGSECTE